MAQLTQAFFRKILQMEGGFQNMPDDNGNYACGQIIGTNMGVSAVALREWWGRCPSVEEMRNLSQKQAFDFYAWFFDRANLYAVENQELFEFLANNTMGSPTAAARTEQKVLNRLGYSVAVDGKRGPATVQALNAAWRRDPNRLWNEIRAEWIRYLQSINKPQFLPGWISRLNRHYPEKGAATTDNIIWLAPLAVLALLLIRK